MAPELVEEFVRAFPKEVNNRRREDDLLLEANKRELAEVRRKLNGLIDAIAEGLRTPGLQKRLEELELRRTELEQEIGSASTPPVRLHPNLAQIYRRKVERLQHALNDLYGYGRRQKERTCPQCKAGPFGKGGCGGRI
jgi:hypothetical protein